MLTTRCLAKSRQQNHCLVLINGLCMSVSHRIHVCMVYYVVVWNIFYVHPYQGKWSHFTNIFSNGLVQPPTSIIYLPLFTWHENHINHSHGIVSIIDIRRFGPLPFEETLCQVDRVTTPSVKLDNLPPWDCRSWKFHAWGFQPFDVWWFEILVPFVFNPTWGNDPIWRTHSIHVWYIYLHLP